MSSPWGRYFTGALYEFTDNEEMLISKLNDFQLLKQQAEIHQGWKHLIIESNTALISADADYNPPFFYNYLLRSSSKGKRFMLLSTHGELVARFLDKLHWNNNVKTALVKVYDLVQSLVQNPDIYCLGNVHSSIDGYGRSLQKISLYGADLAEAKMFREILPKLVPYRAQLRDIKKRNEVLQIGTKGDIGFYCHSQRNLKEVDKALLFLTKQGFLSWGMDD